MVAAVIWPKYCRYGVKTYLINESIDHPYILNILYSYYCVSNQGKIVNFCWIPSHIGLHGNNEADKAKSALELDIVMFEIPSTDL